MSASRWYIIIQAVFWIGAYLILSIPSDLVSISYDNQLEPDDLSWFLFYGSVLNALLIYSYAHVALPYYLKNSKIGYFLVINIAYLFFFNFTESFVDNLSFGYIYEQPLETEGPPSFVQFFLDNLPTNTIILIIANAYGFGFAWFRDQQTKRILEREKLKAELSALKHQVHPHFLFNVLNGLYGMAYKNDDEETAEGIAKLSNMMRYMIYESDSELVPLARELDYISNYVDIQRLRIDENVNLEYIIEGNPDEKKIVPMILIPFIENAFKYGISTTQATKISIQFSIQSDQLKAFIYNDIHHQAFEKRSTKFGGVGLENVKKRLTIIYGDSYDLKINSNKTSYKVSLILPL